MKVLYCDRCGKVCSALLSVKVADSFDSKFLSVRTKEFELCGCCKSELEDFKRMVYSNTAKLEIELLDYFMKQKGVNKNETN